MDNNQTFEQAYDRLEKILQEMSEENLELERSLKLFEEANNLIIFCQKKLNSTQQKMEVLIKERDNSLQLNEAKSPAMQELDLL